MKTYPTNQILKNKIAIITGAGSGIGKCMVERFVQEGAQCLAADLNQDSLNALVEDLGDFAGMVRTLQVDVSDRSQVENMVEEAVKQFGGLDILVNNAGVMDNLLPIAEMEDDVWGTVASHQPLFRYVRYSEGGAVLPESPPGRCYHQHRVSIRAVCGPGAAAPIRPPNSALWD